MTFNEIPGLRRPAALLRALAVGVLAVLTMAGAASASGCGKPVIAGQHDLSISSGGLERSAVAYIPKNYSGAKKVALVFDLHGSNSFPAAQMARSRWPDVADKEGFIVVAPQGGLDGNVAGTHAWNVPGVTPGDGPDDEAFLKAAVRAARDTYCIDPDRIYASGYSGGGRMLSQFLCNGNSEFSAAGFVMSLRAGYPRQKDGTWQPDGDSCHPAKPVSIIAFWGLKDNTNPFAGGGKAYWQYSGETALKRWADLDGCKGDMRAVNGDVISSMAFDNCRGGARVLSYTIANNTHAWPSSSVLFTLAKTENDLGREVDAAARMWDFFMSGQGQLMADIAVKSACKDIATPDGAEAGLQGTKCSQQGKPDSRGPGAAGAL